MVRFVCSVVMILLLCGSAEAMIIEKVVAVVNGQVITLTELQERALILKKNLGKEDVPLKDILNKLIMDTLEVQRAKELGLSVDDHVVDEYISNLLKKEGMTMDELKAKLQEWGVSMNLYRQEIRRRILISKVVNLEVRSHVAVPDEEVKAYYMKVRDERFHQPPMAHVEDVFIPAKKNMAEAKKLAQQVYEKVKLGEPLKKIATLQDLRYADIDDVKKGELVPELDKFIFSSKTGDVGIVDSKNGVHVVKIDSLKEEVYVPYEQVKEKLKAELEAKMGEELYRKWLHKLQSRAFIKVFL